MKKQKNTANKWLLCIEFIYITNKNKPTTKKHPSSNGNSPNKGEEEINLKFELACQQIN